jgi:thermitase
LTSDKIKQVVYLMQGCIMFFLSELCAVSMAICSVWGESDTWALRVTGVPAAWQRFADKGSRPGEGVVVAHIDTGVSFHPELLGANILWDFAYNFIDKTKDVRHRFSGGQFPPHGHGTETLSVMASLPGCPAGVSQGACVTGVAPAASYIPLLVSDSAIVGKGALVAKALDYAVEKGAHVVNISLGHIVAMPEVEQALRRAREAGVIVVAAAGNGTKRMRVYPAAYDTAIAVGGTNEASQPWDGSSVGSHVAWSAPAKGVFAAFTEERDGEFIYNIRQTAGTSDAAAITSGIAALWLSYFGRDELIARFGKQNLVEAFVAAVKGHGLVVPQSWPTQDYGVGIIHAGRLLDSSVTRFFPGSEF